MTQTIIDKLERAEGPDRRILDRLDRSGDCWLWTGALDERGRGRVWRNGSICIHHRAIWSILVGPIPKGALLCHHCDNPTCANPDHLYIGNSKTNVDDMMRRGRHWTARDPERAKAVAAGNGSQNNWVKGERNPKAKLRQDQAIEIANSSDGNRALAERYGVHITSIQRIRRGAAWVS